MDNFYGQGVNSYHSCYSTRTPIHPLGIFGSGVNSYHSCYSTPDWLNVIASVKAVNSYHSCYSTVLRLCFYLCDTKVNSYHGCYSTWEREDHSEALPTSTLIIVVTQPTLLFIITPSPCLALPPQVCFTRPAEAQYLAWRIRWVMVLFFAGNSYHCY